MTNVKLPSNAELFDKFEISFAAASGDIFKQSFTLANQLQQRPAGGKIMLMGFQMIC